MITINYYERVKEKPEIFTQLTCKDLLFVHYKCPSIESLIGKEIPPEKKKGFFKRLFGKKDKKDGG